MKLETSLPIAATVNYIYEHYFVSHVNLKEPVASVRDWVKGHGRDALIELQRCALKEHTFMKVSN